ncbi:hypothetical protein L209DRAFT_602341 [Thermothelomyces heterothallicus CBS 203.75]
MDTTDTEILVHIAAPARVTDDKRYRAFATAYLDFQETARTSVVLGMPADCQESNRDVLPPGTSSQGVIRSPMLSFQSATDNLGSPRLQQPGVGNVPESQSSSSSSSPSPSSSSWRPPPSVIEDSMPDNDCAFAQYCTPTRILSHYTSAMDTSPLSQRRQGQALPASSQPQESPSQASVSDSSIQHQASREETDSAIPLSPGRQHESQGTATPSPSAKREESEIASSYPSQPAEPPSSFRAESEPPLPKRPRTSWDPEPGKSLVRSASDMGPRRAKARVMFNQCQNDTLEILSPPPITSLRELRPEDMVTDVLASLARELDLEKRFRPESQIRELRPFERGYWLVDCSAWEPDLKRSAWGFLTDYLRKGAAGWGTSCRRDREFSRIRLYCWGCVVGHMYLVLYLMSKRRVLYSGASWVDGEGKAVVVMGPRPASV